MKLALITLTDQARETAKICQGAFGGDILHRPKPFKACVQEAFRQYDGLIFIMATGIVVRTIGPVCDHKSTDPCVIVMDEKAQNIISLLSGHLGDGNAWTLKIANLFKANPVITTASDVNGLLSVDMLAKKYNLHLDDFEGAKTLTQMLLHHAQIQVVGSAIIDEKNYTCDPGGPVLYIGHDKRNFQGISSQLYPKNLVLAMGCKKHTCLGALQAFVEEVMADKGYHISCLQTLASAWLKADEPGLLGLKDLWDLDFVTYDQAALLAVEDLFEGSDFVKKITGVKSVALASGYLASDRGNLLIDIIKKEGMTLCLWERRGEPCYTS